MKRLLARIWRPIEIAITAVAILVAGIGLCAVLLVRVAAAAVDEDREHDDEKP